MADMKRALILMLLICAAGSRPAVAQPVASVALRQFQPFGDLEFYESFAAVDSAGDFAAVMTYLGGSDEQDTAIWRFDGATGLIQHREGLTTVLNHGIVGDDFSVVLGNLRESVGVNRFGQLASAGALRVQCADPDDPACVYNEGIAAFRDDSYMLGETDPVFVCDITDYGYATGAAVDDAGYLYTALSPPGLSLQDNLARSIGAGTETLICQDDPVADGGWGRIKSGTRFDVVASTATWYAINLLRQLPSDRNLALVAAGEVLLREGDVVSFWDEPGVTATLADIDDAALSARGVPLWSGQLALSDDVDSSNNDVIGFGSVVIMQEGDLIEGVPDALTVAFGRLSGGGSGRCLAIDDDCNVIWALTCIATYPGPDWPQDPDDTYQENVQVVIYNAQTILATGTPIDQNNDGAVDADDFGAIYLGDDGDLALSGSGDAWFVGEGLLSLGTRQCVFRLSGLPDTTNPWCDHEPPCPGDVDGDGATGQPDLGLLLASYELPPDDPFFDPRADLNGDGEVGQSDLGILLADYGCGG